MTVMICVRNESTLCTDSDVLKWTIACAKQLREHAVPAWGIEMPAVYFAPDEAHVMPGFEVMYIFDNSDTAGALGFHDVDLLGRAYSKVFAKDTIENGGDVSVTLSHEMLEMAWDPTCDLFKENTDGFSYAREAADAVEDYSYDVGGVNVSDFLLDPFFDPHAPEGSRFDYIGKLTRPFQTAPGGYQIREDAHGNITQVFGEKREAWRNVGKDHVAARTARRLRAGGRPIS